MVLAVGDPRLAFDYSPRVRDYFIERKERDETVAEMSSSDENRVVRFIVVTLEDEPCSVFFEPEGAEVVLDPGETFTVEMSGGKGVVQPEIAFVRNGISVCAWIGADTRAWRSNGDALNI